MTQIASIACSCVSPILLFIASAPLVDVEEHILPASEVNATTQKGAAHG